MVCPVHEYHHPAACDEMCRTESSRIAATPWCPAIHVATGPAADTQSQTNFDVIFRCAEVLDAAFRVVFLAVVGSADLRFAGGLGVCAGSFAAFFPADVAAGGFAFVADFVAAFAGVLVATRFLTAAFLAGASFLAGAVGLIIAGAAGLGRRAAGFCFVATGTSVAAISMPNTSDSSAVSSTLALCGTFFD